LQVAIVLPEEALRDEEFGRMAFLRRRGFDFLVEHQHGSAGRERELRTVRLAGVLWRVERQIEHREGEHDFREIPARLCEMR
jgi:hypothetical protein